MTKYKYDDDVAYSLLFKAERVRDLMRVAHYCNGEDQEYWYNEAIRYAEKLASALETYQKDEWYKENDPEIDPEIPF